MQSFAVNNSYQARAQKIESQSTTRVLALIWSTAIGAALLASTLSGLLLPILMLALAALLSALISRKTTAKVERQQPEAANFSHASACIWKLDREA